jgi:hypothetical protein
MNFSDEKLISGESLESDADSEKKFVAAKFREKYEALPKDEKGIPLKDLSTELVSNKFKNGSSGVEIEEWVKQYSTNEFMWAYNYFQILVREDVLKAIKKDSEEWEKKFSIEFRGVFELFIDEFKSSQMHFLSYLNKNLEEMVLLFASKILPEFRKLEEEIEATGNIKDDVAGRNTVVEKMCYVVKKHNPTIKSPTNIADQFIFYGEDLVEEIGEMLEASV